MRATEKLKLNLITQGVVIGGHSLTVEVCRYSRRRAEIQWLPRCRVVEILPGYARTILGFHTVTELSKSAALKVVEGEHYTEIYAL